MGYLLLYLLAWPLAFLAPRRKASGSLVIHTGKIGDYVNVSVLFERLGTCDILIDAVNQPFAGRDERIGRVYLANQAKAGALARLKLAWQLFSRHYDAVYVTTPNSFNLFLGLFARPRCKRALISTFSGNTVRTLARLYSSSLVHEDYGLTVDSFAALAGTARGQTPRTRIVSRLEPGRMHPLIRDARCFKVGVAIASGNRAKSIPPAEWAWLFGQVAERQGTLFILGTGADQPFLDAVMDLVPADTAKAVCSLLGQIPLADLPDSIAGLDLLIGADTGSCYIADSVDVPVLVYAGACPMQEQRPLGKEVLIVMPEQKIAEPNYIFRTLYNRDWQHLYHTTEKQRFGIKDFIVRQIDRAQINANSLQSPNDHQS